MESLLDSVHYLYNYHMVCALLSHTHHVMWPLWHPDIWPWYVTFVIWHLPTLLPCSKSKWEEKRKRKRKINNNLAVLPSHDTPLFGPKIHPSKSCYQHHYILYKGEVFWPDHGSYTHPPSFPWWCPYSSSPCCRLRSTQSTRSTRDRQTMGGCNEDRILVVSINLLRCLQPRFHSIWAKAWRIMKSQKKSMECSTLERKRWNYLSRRNSSSNKEMKALLLGELPALNLGYS